MSLGIVDSSQDRSGIDEHNESNRRARGTWEVTAVGQHRSTSEKGSPDYFRQIREYRYGYETPWIPRLFQFSQLAGKRVLEIGVGNGVDAVEMAHAGADYTGIDITVNHLNLTRQNFASRLPDTPYQLKEGDLLNASFEEPFDVVYSFGVLHHIAHEQDYLLRIRQLLKPDGRLLFAVYGKFSFFNLWLALTWLLKNRCQNSFDDWRSHLSEFSPLGQPVTIMIRSRREVEAALRSAGFDVEKYAKRGFVKNYLPVIGKYLQADGWTLNTLGSRLGWYHIFHCIPVADAASRS